MSIRKKRVPWAHYEWWQAGNTDARSCISPRYDGSDYAEEACAAYIQGYQNGMELNRRTVPCEKLAPSSPFTYEETSTEIPSSFPAFFERFFDEWAWTILTPLILTALLSLGLYLMGGLFS